MKFKYLALVCILLTSISSLFANDLDSFSELILKDRSNEAISRINQNIKKYPNDPQLVFYRAVLFDYFGRINEAKGDFLVLSNRYPKNPVLKNNLGVIYAKLGEYFNAQFCFESALRLKPDYREAKANFLAVQRKNNISLALK